jgi:hypothetical protein
LSIEILISSKKRKKNILEDSTSLKIVDVSGSFAAVFAAAGVAGVAGVGVVGVAIVAGCGVRTIFLLYNPLGKNSE